MNLQVAATKNLLDGGSAIPFTGEEQRSGLEVNRDRPTVLAARLAAVSKHYLERCVAIDGRRIQLVRNILNGSLAKEACRPWNSR